MKHKKTRWVVQSVLFLSPLWLPTFASAEEVVEGALVTREHKEERGQVFHEYIGNLQLSVYVHTDIQNAPLQFNDLGNIKSLERSKDGKVSLIVSQANQTESLSIDFKNADQARLFSQEMAHPGSRRYQILLTELKSKSIQPSSVKVKELQTDRTLSMVDFMKELQQKDARREQLEKGNYGIHQIQKLADWMDGAGIYYKGPTFKAATVSDSNQAKVEATPASAEASREAHQASSSGSAAH